MLSCTSLRTGILGAAALMAVGFVVAFLAAVGLLPTVSAGYLGFYLVVGGVLALLVLFAVSLTPSAARSLAECRH
jgi:uncharacterized membrane protein (DUF441 family)